MKKSETKEELKKCKLNDDELEKISGGCWATGADVIKINNYMESQKQQYGIGSSQYMNCKTVYTMLENDGAAHTFNDFKRMMSMFFNVSV